MKQHTKIYMNALGYDISDFMPSELSGAKGVDIHHIVNRENRIENLMLLTREEHIKISARLKIKWYSSIRLIHKNFLDLNGVSYSDNWFKEQINKYENL